MSVVLIARFAEGDALLSAAKRAGDAATVLDAFTPFPVEGMAELLDIPRSRIPLLMAIGGIAVAALAFGTEWYSAVVNYPINSGGRPLNSWPAFMLVPFAVGILGAAVTGFAALLIDNGLPRLHHPLFAIAGMEQASQNAFLLAIAAETDDVDRLRAALEGAGAEAVREVLR